MAELLKKNGPLPIAAALGPEMKLVAQDGDDGEAWLVPPGALARGATVATEAALPTPSATLLGTRYRITDIARTVECMDDLAGSFEWVLL